MDIKTMTVNAADKTIAINGEGYVCSDFPDTDPNIVSLSWHPKRQGRCKGSIHRHKGGGQGLDDFSLLQPYVKVWEDARERTLSRKAMERAEAQGAFGQPLPEAFAPPADIQRLADFDARVRETVREAAETMHPDQGPEIAELKERISKLEGIILTVAERFDREVGGDGA